MSRSPILLSPHPSRILLTIAVMSTMTGSPVIGADPARAAVSFEVESLDGSRNNLSRPTQGRVGTAYSRVGAARYGDGRSQPVTGPNSRLVSNRAFNDAHQNIFSEHRVTQWGWTWGQFLDRTFGLADAGTEAADIPFNANDPLETFTDTLGVVPFGQNGVTATIANASWNATLPAGATLTGVGFNGAWDNVTGPLPVNFSLNGRRCALG